MKLITYKEKKLKSVYGIQCFNELEPINCHGASFFPSFCRVEVGGSTLEHAHFETEIFLIKSGKAIAIVDGQEFSLRENDQLVVHPFDEHTIKNIGESPLEFYSVYSRVNNNKESASKNTLIISAPPTPNGCLHLGHLSGPYLSSDVLRRYKALRGENVAHFTGTDDHQSYTYKLAEILNAEHSEVVQNFRDKIKEDLVRASIDVQKFSSPLKDQAYKKFVKDMFNSLAKSSSVLRSDVDLPFDQGFKYEAFLEGQCPECGESVVGQCCETCGYVGDAQSFTKIKTKSFSSYVLDLPEFKEKLKHYHESLSLSGEVYIRARKWRDNLKPFTLTHPDGIGVDGVHVWCEMAFALLFQREQFKCEIDELTYCFGIDNSYYYLILVPAILFALNEDNKLPSRVIINDFYQLDGSKFSTSREHVLWVKDFSKNDIDYLRFYLALTRSERERGSFSINDFEKFKIGLKKLFNKLSDISSGYIGKVNLQQIENKKFYQRAVDRLLRMEDNMGRNFSLNNYAKEAHELINDFLIFAEAGEVGLEEKRTFIPLVKMAIYPLMPNTFEKDDFCGEWNLDLRKDE